MADDSPKSDDAEGARVKGWNKLRGKIFDKDGKLSRFKRHHDHAANSDQDVNDFLRPSTASAPVWSAPAAPKLDISAAKAHGVSSSDDGGFLESTSANVGGEGGIPSYAPTREDMMSGKWRPKKPTRRPGLRVGFDDGPTEVIGEGGDESEEAPQAIGLRRKTAWGQHQRHPPPVAPSRSQRLMGTDEPLMPGRLRRAATGFIGENEAGYEASKDPRRPTDYRTSDSSPQGDRVPANPTDPPRPSRKSISSPEEDEEELIRPLRRAPTGFDEAREHRRRLDNAAPAELHLSSPESPPDSRSQQPSYEQQLQQILTNTYAQPGSSSRGESPETRMPQKPAIAQQDQTLRALEGGNAHPDRPSLRSYSISPNRPAKKTAASADVSAPEIRSPVDSGSMRKMRAEEGLVHRNSVQGAPGGDNAATAAIDRTSPGLDAPLPYSAQGRSSFDSIRSGSSEQSRYSHSPEPSSLPANTRFSAASIEGAQYLSPPSSSHGTTQRGDSSGTRHNVASQEYAGTSSHDRTAFTAVSPGQVPRRGDSHSSVERPAPLNIQSNTNRQSTSTQLAPGKSSAAEEAYTYFASAVSGTGSIFKLAVENAGMHMTLYDWTRCALWWFSKGREAIDEFIKSQNIRQQDLSGHTRGQNDQTLRQHHINLAKAYWLLSEAIPHLLNNTQSNPKVCPSSQNVDSVDAACTALNESFKLLCTSMRKWNILPSPQEKLIEGVDTSVWQSQPFDMLPPDWQWVLSGKVFAPPRQTSDVEPLTSFPLRDTSSSYCYGRIFVSATVALGDEKSRMEPFECALSFVRAKRSAEAEVIISSQTNDVNVHIRAVGEHGVHWEHTKFEHEERSLRIKLPQKLRMKLYCSQRDYNYLSNFYENSRRISQSLLPKKGERLLQSMRLNSFHYRDSSHPEEFPSDPVGICRAALFEQLLHSDRDRRQVHAGHRLAVVNLEKTVRNVNISFGKTAPFEHSISGSQPVLQFQLNEAGRRRSAHVVFEDVQQRDILRDLLSGTVLGKNESMLCQIPLSSLAFNRATASNLAPAVLKWTSLQVIDEDDPADPQHLSSSADASENLRVMMYSRTGSVVDRMNDAATEFKIRLEAGHSEQLQIYRGGSRHDLTVSIGPDPSETNELRQIFDVVTSGPHVSVYSFPTIQDLYKFQRAVTGFAVKYDGVASSFSIPRRKPGSLVAKHLESKEARIQIVERERVIQLIAFFHDYILADSLNFEVKRTDRFDQMESKTLGYGVKLVDAKFVLPGSGKDDPVNDGALRDVSAKFTAFDTENYNQEHDDITISFPSEQERDRFAEALPAPVSLGKKFTLRRRI